MSRNPVCIKGIGIHSGLSCKLNIKSNLSNKKIAFFLGDEKIPACIDYVSKNLNLNTSLSGSRQSIHTTEHFLAACYLLNITQLDVFCSSNELPILDGSALEFYKVLSPLKENVDFQKKSVFSMPCIDSLNFDDDKFFLLYPSETFQITYLLNYMHPKIGFKVFHFDVDKQDPYPVICSRTFGFIEDLEWLRANNKALGASFENALVYDAKSNINELRHNDELAAHKVLDMIGDLALLGKQLKIKIVAHKTGHAQTIALARYLRDKYGA